MDAQIFKAVEMTRQIRDRHYQKILDKSYAERIAFYQQQAQEMESKLSVLLHDQAMISKPASR